MVSRKKVTDEILKHSPIPKGMENPEYYDYYNDYRDNLYGGELGPEALRAYNNGNGAETKPTEKKKKNGTKVIYPPKMACVTSSSALTFNLLGNEPVNIISESIIPLATYKVEFEKKMYTIRKGSNPANLDAFLFDKENKTAVFCEMKFLEWLSSPGALKEAYLNKEYYFNPDNNEVSNPIDAYAVFSDFIEKIKGETIVDGKTGKISYKSKYECYDAWQMLKHIIAIYNYTSLVTKKAVDLYDENSSMAGEFKNVFLLNVVNEFPAALMTDSSTKDKYKRRLEKEKEEALDFKDIVSNKSGIPELFLKNCNVFFNVTYVTAKEFTDAMEMDEKKRNYLKRYF